MGFNVPSNPAPVSGPGALSKRTDGGPTQAATYIPGLPYGQGQETYSNQVAQPLAGNSYAQEMPTELLAKTTRPNEAVTSGIDLGPGVGSNAISLPNQHKSFTQVLEELIPYDASGELELVYRQLVDNGNMG